MLRLCDATTPGLPHLNATIGPEGTKASPVADRMFALSYLPAGIRHAEVRTPSRRRLIPAYRLRNANDLVVGTDDVGGVPVVDGEANVPVIDVPTVMVELEVIVNPAGNCPTLEFCGFEDKIRLPLPLLSVLIDPTLVPSIETGNVAFGSAPVTCTRRICVVVPSELVNVFNTALPAETPEFVNGATNLVTLPLSPWQPCLRPFPIPISPEAVANVPFNAATVGSVEASPIVAPAATVKPAGNVPAAVGLLGGVVVLELDEVKQSWPLPLASVVKVPRLVVPTVTA